MTNDYELEMISKATQRAELRALTGGVITTLGEQGSVIDNGERGSVGIAAPKTVADPPARAIRSARPAQGLLHDAPMPAPARRDVRQLLHRASGHAERACVYL